MPTLTSPNGPLEYGPGRPTMLINDELRIMNQVPEVLEQLSEGRIDIMVDLARKGQRAGLDVPAILITYPGIDEVELLPRIAVAVQKEVGCPVGLDSRNPEAVEAALAAMQPYRSIIWTVSAEQELLDTLLPIAKRYQAAVVGMPMGRTGSRVPMTAAERLAEARFIVEACEGYGIPRDDIVIDAICLAASTLEPDSFQVTLETLKLVHSELGVATQLGISNAGHGMPDKTRIDLAFLLGAMPWGLDSAFVNPGTVALIESVRAMDFLTGRDPVGRGYIRNWRAGRRPTDRSGVPTMAAPAQ